MGFVEGQRHFHFLDGGIHFESVKLEVEQLDFLLGPGEIIFDRLVLLLHLLGKSFHFFLHECSHLEILVEFGNELLLLVQSILKENYMISIARLLITVLLT